MTQCRGMLGQWGQRWCKGGEVPSYNQADRVGIGFLTGKGDNICNVNKLNIQLKIEKKRNFHQGPILIPQQMVAEEGEDLGHPIEI